MAVFLSIILMLYICCFGKKNNSRDYQTHLLGYYLFFIYLILLTICRYNVGYDYHTYYGYLIKENPWAEKYFEPIPRLLLIFCRKHNTPFLFFFSINVTIICLVFHSIFENSKNKFESILIFITLFYLDSLSIIRQWLAIAIILYGFKFIKNKLFFKYLICVITATLCHSSAIVSILIYFIYNYIPVKLNLAFSILCLFFGKYIITVIFFVSFLAPYQNYFTNLFINGGTKLIYIWYIFFVFVLLIFMRSKDRKNLEKYISIICYGLVFPALLGPSMGLRVSVYFNVFYIFLFPLVFNKINFNGLRYFATLPFELYYLLFLYIDSCNDRGYTKYIFYFLRGI